MIAIHTTASLTLATTPGFAVVAGLSLNVASRFAVPLFFILSGFQLGLGGVPHRSFHRRTLPRIAGVYLAWALFYGAIKALAGWSPTAIIVGILTFSVYYHLWFLGVLIQLYLVHPWLYRWYRRIRPRPVTCLLAAVLGQTLWTVGLTLLERPVSSPGGTATLLSVLALNSVAFFVAGYALADHAGPSLLILGDRRIRLAGVVVVVAVVAVVVSGWVVGIHTFGGFYRIPHRYLIFRLLEPLLVAAAFILLIPVAAALRSRKGVGYRFFHRLGFYSLGIYLIHPFFRTVYEYTIERRHWVGYESAFFYLIGFPLVVGCSLLAIRVMSRLPGIRNLV